MSGSYDETYRNLMVTKPIIMKQRILLLTLFSFCICTLHAQKKAKKTTAYAITGVQKGQNNWTEVRLIDVATGEEVKTVYQATQEVEALNARTGKAIAKKDAGNDLRLQKTVRTNLAPAAKKVVNLDDALDTRSNIVIRDLQASKVDGNHIEITRKDEKGNVVQYRKVVTAYSKVQSDKPFATNSAACAYDKKHERLYYTPMGINQLRYIDLKSNSPKIYYFEDEPFGALKHRGDVPNQITRMVIGADGDGYALTNNGAHLVKFTTGKKPVITDLGALTNDAASTVSVHSESGYGGDLIAGKSGALYLITANRRVFKIDVETRMATYKGAIQGLPKGYSTNGAIVAEGTAVIVNSSNSTEGYFKFDLTTLQAEKVSNGGSVFNSSDLANGNLVAEKKKRKEQKEELKPEVPEEAIATKAEKGRKERTACSK